MSESTLKEYNEQRRKELKEYDGEYRVVSSLQKIMEIDNLPPVQTIKTGFPVLDEWMLGMAQGELVILSGVPKSGKSLLMKTWIKNLSQSGQHPLVFSFEEQTRYFLESFENKAKDILFYMPNVIKAYDVDWIIERVVEAKEKIDTKVVFIDHGHFLFEMSNMNNSSLTIGDCARKLKRLAVDEDVVVILIWHLYKTKIESIDDLDKEQLRDSGMIACEMDSLIFTHREVKSDGMTQLEESYLKLDVTRRSGAFKRVIPIKKVGPYFEEMGIDI
jgi:replicative DNA helicase